MILFLPLSSTEDGSKTSGGVFVFLYISCVNSFTLIEGDKSFCVGVASELALENTVRTHSREGNGTVCTLSPGNVRISKLRFAYGLTRIRHPAHSLNKVDVCARHYKYSLFFHKKPLKTIFYNYTFFHSTLYHDIIAIANGIFINFSEEENPLDIRGLKKV